MRLALKFAYDGRKFHGFARQPELQTIEGEIIKTLIRHDFIEDIKKSNFRYASRTDKGVSAFGNVIAFNTSFSKEYIIEEINDDSTEILFYGIKDVESDFFPRYARHRIYRYYLKNKNLEIDNIISTVSLFVGKFNFSNFAKLEEYKNPVRTIDNIVVTIQRDFLIIDFYAQTYLWNQVRRIVSAILGIGTGKFKKEQVIEALYNPNKKFDFGLAPSEFLILHDIIYDFEFECDKKITDKLKSFKKRLISSL